MLYDAKQDKFVTTTYDFLSLEELNETFSQSGWEKGFEWNLYFEGDPDIEVYKLMVQGSRRVEGIVAIQIKVDHVYILLAESAPHNRGKDRCYQFVGGHLFAIGCQRSMQKGLDGYVALDAKTSLIKHYKDTYNMQRVFGQRMIIDELAARELIRLYLP